jgi:hypothetical protein
MFGTLAGCISKEQLVPEQRHLPQSESNRLRYDSVRRRLQTSPFKVTVMSTRTQTSEQPKAGALNSGCYTTRSGRGKQEKLAGILINLLCGCVLPTQRLHAFHSVLRKKNSRSFAKREISGSHGGEYDDDSLPGYCAMLTCRS